jgi:hypothetical protein
MALPSMLEAGEDILPAEGRSRKRWGDAGQRGFAGFDGFWETSYATITSSR